MPAWAASPKLETAARTLRPKIHSLLPRFLAPFPAALPATRPWPGPDGAGAAAGAAALPQPPAVDWDALVGAAASDDPSVPELAWAAPGEAAGLAALAAFLAPPRLALYGTKRNDPNAPHAQSGLSPWLHAGQLSAQRCALDAAAAKRAPGGAAHAASIDSFLEELVVRKELADNFCLHQPRYDDLAGAAEWARASLAAHASDPREHVYSRAQLDGGRTADRLWNAAQQQLVHCGKLHGFLRMYWAKKVLEWGATPAAALADAIHLNDRYSLDGRDPNGYVGCMWSVAGVHDMGWKERPVFGKIRRAFPPHPMAWGRSLWWWHLALTPAQVHELRRLQAQVRR